MKKHCNKLGPWVLSVGVLGLIVALWPAAGLSQDEMEPQDPWAKYEIILERNMFSRQRGFAQRREEERPEIVIPNPESYFVLKGIVQEDGQFIAFLENTRDSSVLKVRQGDRVARGIVKSLTLDTIDYEFEEKTATIRLGNDLEGGLGAVTMNELIEFSDTAPTGQPAAAEAPPTGEAADMLKQLLERRKQELGR